MSINCVDRMGLEIWQITNSNAVSGAGHTAMISGSGNNFQLQSYGSGFLGSASSSASSSNGLTTQNYSSSQAAINAAASQGYNGFNRWDTTPEQDTAARNGFSANANSGPYSVGSHNCANALTAGLEAAGVNHEGGSNIPNQVHTANKGLADSTGTLTKPE